MNEKFAVAYARFSTDKQNYTSIEVQIEKIEQFCKENKFILIEKYIDEAQSGTNDRRKNFQRMIQDSENGLFKYVIVHRNDRWARNTEDAMYYKKLLSLRGVKILSVIENFDTKTPEGGFFNLVSMGMAELYTKKLTRESWEGLLATARECKVIGGNPPYGYKIEGTGKNKRYAIDPEKAVVIKELFEEVAKGSSYIQAYNKLKEKGVDLQGFSISSIVDRLRNSKYKGEYVFNQQIHRTPDNKKMRHQYKDESEIIRIPNGFPRIISDELFDKVQRILDGRKHRKIMKKDTPYLLASLIRCGECGKAVSGSVCGSSKRGLLRHTYICSSNTLPRCNQKPINIRLLDEYIVALVKNVFLKVENAKWLKDLITLAVKNKKSSHQLEIKDNLRKIENLEEIINEKNELKFSKQLNVTAQEFLEEEISSLMKEKSKLQATNIKLDYELNEIDEVVYIEQIRRAIREYKPQFATLDLKSKREILKKLIHKIVMYRDKVSVFVNLWCYVVPNYNNELANELLVEIEEDRDFLTFQNFNRDKVVANNLQFTNLPKLEE